MSSSSNTNCALAGGCLVSPQHITIQVNSTTEKITEARKSNKIHTECEKEKMNAGAVKGKENNVKVDNNDSDVEAGSQADGKCALNLAEPDQTEKTNLSFTSLVDSHFCAEIRVTLTCDSCCYSRHKTEMYRHLSIEVGCEDEESNTMGTSPSTASVEDGIRRFFAPEKREIKCEKCFCETATQTMKLVRLPNALLLHLKRFIVEYSPSYRVSYRKNQANVEFSNKLDLSEYCAVDVTFPKTSALVHNYSYPRRRLSNEELVISQLSFETNNYNHDDDQSDVSISSSTSTLTSTRDFERGRYAIKSVVHHIGSNANCGHYAADVLIRNERGERKWQRCNDERVTTYGNNEEVVTSKQYQKTAYMVMYELEV